MGILTDVGIVNITPVKVETTVQKEIVLAHATAINYLRKE